MNSLITNVLSRICKDWKQKLTGNESPEELLELFYHEPQIQEFCLKYNYPPLSELEEIGDLAEQYSLIISRERKLINPETVFAFGDAKLNLAIADNAVCHITARHTAEINITCGQNSIVSVTLYDKATCHSNNPINITQK